MRKFDEGVSLNDSGMRIHQIDACVYLLDFREKIARFLSCAARETLRKQLLVSISIVVNAVDTMHVVIVWTQAQTVLACEFPTVFTIEFQSGFRVRHRNHLTQILAVVQTFMTVLPTTMVHAIHWIKYSLFLFKLSFLILSSHIKRWRSTLIFFKYRLEISFSNER